MKFKNIPFLIVLALSSVLTTSQHAHAQVRCEQALGQKFVAAPRSRGALAAELAQQNLPAVMMPTRNGKIPVVLMNSRTAPVMKNFFGDSIGTLVAHQPDWKNDHGLLRVGDVISDMDIPGGRQRGELHRTGISWVSAQSYLARGGHSNRIEVAYALDAEEMKVARLYTLMRRAAMVRVKFAFGNFAQDTNLPNFLNNGGEHCFVYCSAGALPYQISEIRSRLQATGLGNLDNYLANDEVKNWMQKVKGTLLTLNPDSANDLSPKSVKNIGAFDSLEKNPTFAAMTDDQKQETLNWIVAGALSLDYQKLVSTLGFSATGNGFSAMNNPRATAVLIYDAKVTPAQFTSKNYESRGIFSTWTNAAAEPL